MNRSEQLEEKYGGRWEYNRENGWQCGDGRVVKIEEGEFRLLSGKGDFIEKVEFEWTDEDEGDSYLSRGECIKGNLYRLDSRNLISGVYNGKDGFVGIRLKFNSRFLDTEYHWDTGAPYGTAKPTEDLGPIPAGIEIDTHLGDFSDRDGQEVQVDRRDLRDGENNHGKRQGFVDEWADTGERLPDDVYPKLKSNKELFNFLNERENEN